MTVVLDEMLKGSQFASPVEGESLVRNRAVNDPCGPQLPEMITQGSQGIFAVLQHVVADDEVERPIFDGGEHFAVIHDIHRDQVQVIQFGILEA
ncbi:hypothetical protein D3C87_1773060 [compost metagenome]